MEIIWFEETIATTVNNVFSHYKYTNEKFLFFGN